MENKFLEDKIKSTFDSYQPELDNDAIWTEIEPHLIKKKDRNYIIFWFLLGGIALGLWWLNQDHPAALEKADLILTENVESIPSEAITPQNHVSNELTPVVAEKESNNSISKKEKISLAKKYRKQKPSIQATEILPKGILNPIPNKNQKPLVPLFDWNTNFVAAQSLPFNGLERAPTNYLDKIDTKELKDEYERKWKKIKPQRNNRWDIIFQSTIAPILPIRSLNRKTTGRISYLERRKETESQLEGFGININFQVQNKRGFVIMSGLEYQQFNEKFDQRIFSERTEIVNGPIIIFENANGEVIETINGTRVVTTNIEQRRRRFNNYRFINVPFGIGRAWKNGKTFYKFSGGLTYNMVFSFSGEILSPSTDRTFNGDFKNKVGFGLWMAGEYSRAVNDRLKWVVAPKIQLPFQSITADNYELNQRYFPISLNIGINYLLNPEEKKNPINQNRKK